MENTNTTDIAVVPAWNAVFAIALAVSGLIISEFLPVSLLTPIASELRVAEGMAGQAISVTAIVALLASLLTPVVSQRYDRRYVLLFLCGLQVIANLIVGYAGSFTILLTCRVLLGIGLGGFWSLCTATAMRLVPASEVPKALSIIFGAVSVATVAAAPLCSFLGGLMGWRNVFLGTAGFGAIAFLWQAAALPSMVKEEPASLKLMFRVMRRPGMKLGMLATMLVFAGYGIFFTYLRPFLENITGVSASALTAILLGFSLSNLAGTTLGRFPLEKNIHRTLTVASLALGITVSCIVLFKHNAIVVSGLVALWGFFFGLVQIGWNMWITRVVPDEAESGGGILVAVIQLGIMAGAGAGGYFFDSLGAEANYIAGSIVAVTAALFSVMAFRQIQDSSESKK